MTELGNGYFDSQARELADRSEYAFAASKFLSPAEQIAFAESVSRLGDGDRSRCYFYGGSLNSERREAVFVPSYIETSPFRSGAKAIFDEARTEEFLRITDGFDPAEIHGIVALEVRGSSYVTLSHRDYMGSILALGIERDVVGDIAVTGDFSAVVFVRGVIADYITESLTKAGRDTVSVSRTNLKKDFIIPRKFISLSLVSASRRLDSVVAALTNSSRADAKELCTSGSVELNHVPTTSPDGRVNEGDTVTVRGHGKFLIDSFGGETRSGRLRLSVSRFA